MDNNWAKGYRLFLYNKIIPLAVPQIGDTFIEVRKRLVSADIMKYWYTAVTHHSYDPNHNSNYNNFFELGNRLLDVIIENILLDKFQNNISHNQLHAFIKSAEFRNMKLEVSETINIVKYLRSIFEITVVIKEEVISSLIGALYTVTNEMLGSVNPFLIVKTFVSALFEEKIKNKEIVNSHEDLKFIMKNAGWSESREIDLSELGKIRVLRQRGENVGYELQQKLPPKALQWFKENDIDVKDDSNLGYAIGTDKEEILLEASSKTLNILKSRYGVDLKFIKEIMKNKLEKQVINRMKEADVDNIETVSDTETRRYQLIGIKNGKRKILISAVDKSVGGKRLVEEKLIQLFTLKGAQPFNKIFNISN